MYLLFLTDKLPQNIMLQTRKLNVCKDFLFWILLSCNDRLPSYQPEFHLLQQLSYLFPAFVFAKIEFSQIEFSQVVETRV